MTDLRTRAAVAVAELLFGFNAHQLRGPDGRWVKMADSELKRPRRPGKTTARTEDHPLYRRRREQYNQRIVDIVNDHYTAEPQFSDLLHRLESAEPGEQRDGLVDQLKTALRQRLGENAPLPPEPSTTIPLPRGRARGGPRPDIDQPYVKRRAALQRSIDTGAADEVALAQGAMGEVRRYQLNDGTEAIYKRALRGLPGGPGVGRWTVKDQADAEELAAVLAQALGVRAPAVVRAADDAVYMDVMPGQTADDRWPDRYDIPRGALLGQQGMRIGLLDTLIENPDRHGGNILVDDADELAAIDHGGAFMGSDEGPYINRVVSPFAHQFVSPMDGSYQRINGLSRGDIDHVRRQIESTRRQFERAGRLDWFEAVQRRLAEVTRGADPDDTPRIY